MNVSTKEETSIKGEQTNAGKSNPIETSDKPKLNPEKQTNVHAEKLATHKNRLLEIHSDIKDNQLIVTEVNSAQKRAVWQSQNVAIVRLHQAIEAIDKTLKEIG